MSHKNITRPVLVNPKVYGVKAGVMWWAGEEAARRFGVTEQDLLQAGVESKDILVAEKIIAGLQKINRELIGSHGLELIIDDGYRSPKLYMMAAQRVWQQKRSPAL